MRKNNRGHKKINQSAILIHRKILIFQELTEPCQFLFLTHKEKVKEEMGRKKVMRKAAQILHVDSGSLTLGVDKGLASGHYEVVLERSSVAEVGRLVAKLVE